MMRIFGWGRGSVSGIARRLRFERGATAVEYAIMASLIAAVIVAAVFTLGQRTNSQFDCTADSLVANQNTC